MDSRLFLTNRFHFIHPSGRTPLVVDSHFRVLIQIYIATLQPVHVVEGSFNPCLDWFQFLLFPTKSALSPLSCEVSVLRMRLHDVIAIFLEKSQIH